MIAVINSTDGMAEKNYFDRMNHVLKTDYPGHAFWSSPDQNLQSLINVFNCTNEQVEECYRLLENRYDKRNLVPFWMDRFITAGDEKAIDRITEDLLDEDQRFHGYRKKLKFYAGRHDIKGFETCYKKINKRENLSSETICTIEDFIEWYSCEKGMEAARTFIL